MTRTEALVEWVGVGTERLPVFYNAKLRLMDEFHDYVCYVAETQAKSGSSQAYTSKVQAVSYALLAWLRFLDGRSASWKDADNAKLRGFKDLALKRVKASVRGKGNENAAKRTVNIQLKWIYRYYAWAERTERCGTILGPDEDAPIKSTLNMPSANSKRKIGLDKNAYPLLFGRLGNRSGAQYFASGQDKRKVAEVLSEANDPFIAERNLIILELASRVGWRAGTMTFLESGDFPTHPNEKMPGDGVPIRPAIQKGGHSDSFGVPLTLALRISRFIQWRERWLIQRGWSEKEAKGRLFVSGKTGTPLGNKTITQMIGSAFRKIGVEAGRGAGVHSFRRKYAEDSTRDDLSSRRAGGYSTAMEDVMHGTAHRLGHRSLSSQVAYQRAVHASTHKDHTHELRTSLEEVESELAVAKAENAALRAELSRRGAPANPKGGKKKLR